MKKIALVIMITTLISCDKKPFSYDRELWGTWVEISVRPSKYKLIFKEDTMFKIYIDNNNPTYTDTFLYHFKKRKRQLYLTTIGASHETFALPADINKKGDKMIILGLYPSIPEGISETWFEKQ